jgi:coenzyme F420-0:L-glutamate ligase/coenzyme F420-1:gamma-L-glutamate ligase
LKASLQLFALPDLPMVQAGDNLATLLSAAMARAGLAPEQGDVLAVAQKIVSKAEGRLGFVMANAGIDQSNVGEEGHALLLPRDPDGSAAALAARLGLPVVITDSFGRAWRRGTVGVAIGAAGLPALRDLRGQPDLFGRTLMVSITGFADEIAAATGLVMGQGAEGQPAVLVRGLSWSGAANPASELLRPAQEDLFP